MDAFILTGALGLILIISGVLIRKRKRSEIREWQDFFCVSGGILLEIYSLHIGDVIFITLQLFFIAAASCDLAKNHFST